MQEKFYAKLRKGQFYLLPSGVLIKILSIRRERNILVVRKYDSFENDTMPFDIAPRMLEPLFNISDAAKIVNKKPDTLRKYERQGHIPKVRQFALNERGSYKLRLYSRHDILNLVEALERRRPPGRPGKTNMPGKLNRQDIRKRVSRKFDKFQSNLI